MTAYLHHKFTWEGIDKELKKMDINLSNDLFGICHTLFVDMRQMNKLNAQNRGTLNGGKSAPIGNESFSMKGLCDELIALEQYLAFGFKIASPLVDALCSFRCMYMGRSKVVMQQFQIKSERGTN